MKETHAKPMRFMRNDIILIVSLLLVAALGMLYLFKFRSAGDTVRVTVDGKLYKTYSLSQDITEDIITGENGEYKLGEKITYKVVVTNNGETVLKDMVVADVLKANDVAVETQATLVSGTETIASLEIGKSATLVYEYTITEADLGKTFVNTVTAKGNDTEGGDETPGEKVEEPTPGIKVEKTSDVTVIDNKGTVTYTVKVTNTGNTTETVTLSSIKSIS